MVAMELSDVFLAVKNWLSSWRCRRFVADIPYFYSMDWWKMWSILLAGV